MKQKAFTLIELLIVVAIIAILAAIAVPNFLAAQTRSKVSRVKSDMRTINVAIESYYVDSNKYPYWKTGVTVKEDEYTNLEELTSPIAYLSRIPNDPFSLYPIPNVMSAGQYVYYQRETWADNPAMFEAVVTAFGGDGLKARQYFVFGNGPNVYPDYVRGPYTRYSLTYDPTNGTVSYGDIAVFGP